MSHDLPKRVSRTRRPYFSTRSNGNSAKINLKALRSGILIIYEDFERVGYFAEAFGQYCVDGETTGTLGSQAGDYIHLVLAKRNIWPLHTHYNSYSEHDCFDIIEFLYDFCSKPTKGVHHSYNGCGLHFDKFEGEGLGRAEFRDEINQLLKNYEDGYSLSIQGEIHRMGTGVFENLLDHPLPESDSENVHDRVSTAISKFRKARSTETERKDAVRDLADVLEFLRPQLKSVLISEDEKDLFNLINNFGIRHHNQKQKNKYDKAVWMSWMFHYYCATIHAALNLIERA